MRFLAPALLVAALVSGCATKPATPGMPACCDGSARTPINTGGAR